jgi:MFS family permease
MSFGTASIACLPGYAAIGRLAPLLVVTGRLVQGFSAGVALGGVSVYLSEIATPGHKGFYVSWQSASQQCAVVFAALLGVVLNSVLSPQQMSEWGWRVPLLVGCLIMPVLYLMMRSLDETEEFLARKQHFSFSQIIRSVVANWRVVVLGTMFVTSQ